MLYKYGKHIPVHEFLGPFYDYFAECEIGV